jgi:hypothetical protein
MSCEDEDVTSSVSDEDNYVIVRKLLDYIFNMLSVVIRRWEIRTYLYRTFLL